MKRNFDKCAENFRDLNNDAQLAMRGVAIAAVLNRMQSQETVAKVLGINQASLSAWLKVHGNNKSMAQKAKKVAGKTAAASATSRKTAKITSKKKPIAAKRPLAKAKKKG